eukprot:gene41575-50736_t
MAGPIPEYFNDEVMCALLNNEESVELPFYQALPLNCGLLIKMRSSLLRAYKRSECRFHKVETLQPEQFYSLVKRVVRCADQEQLATHWTVENLWDTARELTIKSLNLNLPLTKDMLIHPLYPRHPLSNRLVFHGDFLARTKIYHAQVARPEGTFTMPQDPLVEQLLQLERQDCARCGGRRALYCGPCGLPLAVASPLLPRVLLPFDVLLLLHPAESLVKCTGVHAQVLCDKAGGQVEVVRWGAERGCNNNQGENTHDKNDENKEDGGDASAARDEKDEDEAALEQLLCGLDPQRDVVLFPYPDAQDAQAFFQRPRTSPSRTPSTTTGEEEGLADRWRLVLLEGSWSYGRKMADKLRRVRRARSLPDVPSVVLRGVVGEYWRFHDK